MARFRTAAAGAALALTLAACGGEATTTEAASGADDAVASAPAAAPIAGSFPTVAGGQIDLASLEGQDTVLWFWAPW